MAVKIAYYPGNTARAASSEVEDCIQPLCKTLGIQLIESFSNLSGVFNATKQELSEAPNIGPVAAMAVFEVLHGG